MNETPETPMIERETTDGPASASSGVVIPQPPQDAAGTGDGRGGGGPDARGKISVSEAVRYADDLAKKNSEALSFIPAPRLHEYAQRGQLLLATENDEPCGFLVFGRAAVMRVYQACVQYDARRREHGLAMVARLVRLATARQAQAISLWCADDLDANGFWQEAGFDFVEQRRGGERRGRVHNRWVMCLPPSLGFESAGNPGHRHDAPPMRAAV